MADNQSLYRYPDKDRWLKVMKEDVYQCGEIEITGSGWFSPADNAHCTFYIHMRSPKSKGRIRGYVAISLGLDGTVKIIRSRKTGITHEESELFQLLTDYLIREKLMYSLIQIKVENIVEDEQDSADWRLRHGKYINRK